MYKYSAKEIARLLSLQVEKVAAYLLPNVKRKGNELCIGSLAGEMGESLKYVSVDQKLGYGVILQLGKVVIY